MDDRNPVRAAGGVVWRRGHGGQPEILVVHRPHYDDWTLPKGKAEPGESDEDCAVREVAEETGLRCRLGRHLLDVDYPVDDGRLKVARYWEMHPSDEEATAHGEVDQVRWVALDDAAEVLSYDNDGRVVEALRAALA